MKNNTKTADTGKISGNLWKASFNSVPSEQIDHLHTSVP